MPLWRILSNPATFTPAQKAALVSSVSSLYTDLGLPAFYVVVLFIDVERDSFFVSGSPQDKFVRIAIEHIAIHYPNVEDDMKNMRRSTIDKINELLEPHIASRGDLKWEYHISETPRDLWTTEGIRPPPFGSAEEKLWAKEDRPLAWENDELKGKL